MANYINKYRNQAAYDADSTKQYPNTSLVGNEIVFQMEKPAFNGIIATFNVTSTENQTKVLGDTGNISKIWIDGVEKTAVSGSYQFSTTGEHEVKYTLIDPTTIGDYAFNQCSSLTSVTIPDSVTSINRQAFYLCSSLTSVEIPNSVTSISGNSFNNTPWWNTYSADTNNHYGNIIYINDVAYKAVSTAITSCDFKNGTVSIGESAFDGCSSLTSVTIPDSVTSIGWSAFQSCSGLTSVTIGNGVTSIGDTAFQNCTNLTSVTIGSGVTSIGDSAFEMCEGLTSVTIPDSVTSIGDYAFGNCSALTSVTVDNGNTVYDSRGNCNAIIKTSTNELVVGCKNTIIPNSVRSIGESAFSGCTNLTSVTIPNSVTSIGWSAFEMCEGLTSVTIPDSVTSIGDYAFTSCSSLENVTIGDGVTSIGDSAFGNCSKFTSITVEATTPPTLGSYAFGNTNNCPIYVPAESVEAYQTATNWSEYASRIQAPVIDDSNVRVEVTVNQSQQAKIYNGNVVTGCDYIKVDGTEISLSTLETNNNYYTFPTGQHTILYKAKNPSNANLGEFEIVPAEGTMTVDSFVASEGFRSLQTYDGEFNVTNIDLPSTIKRIIRFNEESATYDTPFGCTNLTIRNTSEVVYVSEHCQECEEIGGVIDPSDGICKECGGFDEGTGECIDIGEELGIECNLIMPNYTNLYVPASMVTNYEETGWHDVNAIQ